MTDIETLIRQVLKEDAATQHGAPDLVTRITRTGRRIRRRRRIGASVIAVAAVAGVVSASVALATASTGTDRAQRPQAIEPADSPASASADSSPTPVNTPPAQPWWRTWSTDRVYGSKPSAAFISGSDGGDPATVYASGTLGDGTDFVVSYDPATEQYHVPSFVQGWNDNDNFGESVGEGPVRGDAAEYLTLQTPTYATGVEQTETTQWLVVVGRPGTVAADYSADGVTWQAMQVEQGIAVLKLPAIAPRSALVRLSDSAGQYARGPLGGSAG